MRQHWELWLGLEDRGESTVGTDVYDKCRIENALRCLELKHIMGAHHSSTKWSLSMSMSVCQYSGQYSDQYSCQYSGQYSGQYSCQYSGQYSSQYNGHYSGQYSSQYSGQCSGQCVRLIFHICICNLFT